MSAFLNTITLTLDGNATAIANSFPASGTTTNLVVEFGRKFNSANIQFPSSTGLNVKYYLSYNGYDATPNWEEIESVDAAGAPTAANVADVIAAGDIAFLPCTGATHIRITRTAGSGSVVVNASEAVSPFELATYDGSGRQYVFQVGADASNNVAKVITKSAVGSGGQLTMPTDGNLHVGACTLLGITGYATTAGTVFVSDGSGSAGAATLFSFYVPVNTSFNFTFPGVAFGNGVWCDFTTIVGTCTGFVGPAVN